MVYPDGVNETWNAAYCCQGGATSGPDDVAFLSRLIDDLVVGDRVNAAAVWHYPEPTPRATPLVAGRIGFWRGVSVEGDGGVSGRRRLLDRINRPLRPLPRRPRRTSPESVSLPELRAWRSRQGRALRRALDRFSGKGRAQGFALVQRLTTLMQVEATRSDRHAVERAVRNATPSWRVSITP